jgi:hypothetical protein
LVKLSIYIASSSYSNSSFFISYPSLLAKCDITGHNFAYLVDIGEYYPYNFSMFLWEQKEYITPLQRANLRAAHFIPDAVLAVTKEGLRSFLRARGEERGLNSYEEPLAIIETLGLMGMPRRDDILNLFKEIRLLSPPINFFRVSLGFFLMNNHISKNIFPLYCLYIPFC